MEPLFRKSENEYFKISKTLNSLHNITKVLIYENNGITYDITDQFNSIKQNRIELPVFLYMFPRFNGNVFITRNKRIDINQECTCTLYIPIGHKMKIMAA
jgi:hypothetical protein